MLIKNHLNRESKSLDLTISLYRCYDGHKALSSCNTTIYLSGSSPLFDYYNKWRHYLQWNLPCAQLVVYFWYFWWRVISLSKYLNHRQKIMCINFTLEFTLCANVKWISSEVIFRWNLAKSWDICVPGSPSAGIASAGTAAAASATRDWYRDHKASPNFQMSPPKPSPCVMGLLMNVYSWNKVTLSYFSLYAIISSIWCSSFMAFPRSIFSIFHWS